MIQGIALGMAFLLGAPAPDIVTPEALQSRGVDLERLTPVGLSERGDYVVALERVKDLSMKVKGLVYTIRVLRFTDGRLTRVDSLPLPVTHLVNACLGTGSRRDEVLILAEHGTKILSVDLASMEARVHFEHQKGKPGFKAGPFMGCHEGRFFATGWAYDRDMYDEGDLLVEFLPGAGGGLSFDTARGMNMEALAVPTGSHMRAHYLVAPGKVLYSAVVPAEQKTHLLLHDGDKTLKIAQVYSLESFCGCGNRVFYSVQDEARVARSYIADVDVDAGKVATPILVGREGEAYKYPFFSNDGKTLLVTKWDEATKTLALICGEEGNGFQMKEVIRGMQPGAVRLSGDGRVILLMNRQGLRLIRPESIPLPGGPR